MVTASIVAAMGCLLPAKKPPTPPAQPDAKSVAEAVVKELETRKTNPIPVNLVLQASQTINPSESKRPSPVIVRIYQLKSSDKFMAAAYEKLLDDDVATLGDDFIKVTPLTLRPGEQMTVSIDFSLDLRFVGIAAFFRQYDGTQWRVPIPLQAKGEWVKGDWIIRVEEKSISFAAK